MIKLPTKPVLEATTIEVLASETVPITTAEVNRKVASFLNIPQNLLELEGSQGTGTEYSYRMCWVRSGLKKKGIIDNPQRGEWKISTSYLDSKKLNGTGDQNNEK